MSTSCCLPEKPVPTDANRCPQSGWPGKAVDLQTIKALLTERALSQLTPGDYRFCGDPDCDVVYFDMNGSRFATDDLRVPVWQKLPFGSRRVCYCFGESEDSIRAEIEGDGQSSAAERIRAHIAAGRCACDVRNPRGACCLGDVIAAIKDVASTMPTSSNTEAEPLAGQADV
jgi:Zinc binding domain